MASEENEFVKQCIADCFDFMLVNLSKNVDFLVQTLSQEKVLSDADKTRVVGQAQSRKRVLMLLRLLACRPPSTFIAFLTALCCMREDEGAWRCVVKLANEAISNDFILTLEDKDAESLRRVKEQVACELLAPSFIPKRSIMVTTIHKQNKLFYSSLHGISIEFPLDALPPDVPEFQLCVAVCSPSELPMPDTYIVCTPVVWIGTNPPNIKFSQDTVKVCIPHCAVIRCATDLDSMVVVQASFGTTEEADGDLPQQTFNMLDGADGVDFSDGYCVRFKVGHFSGFAGVVDKKRRKREHFENLDHLLISRCAIQSEFGMPKMKKSCSIEHEYAEDEFQPRRSTWSHSIQPQKPVFRKQLTVHFPVHPLPLEKMLPCHFSASKIFVEHDAGVGLREDLYQTSAIRLEIMCCLPIRRHTSFNFLFLVQCDLPGNTERMRIAAEKYGPFRVNRIGSSDMNVESRHGCLQIPHEGSAALSFNTLLNSHLNGWEVDPVSEKQPKVVLDSHSVGDVSQLPYTAMDDDATGML